MTSRCCSPGALIGAAGTYRPGLTCAETPTATSVTIALVMGTIADGPSFAASRSGEPFAPTASTGCRDVIGDTPAAASASASCCRSATGSNRPAASKPDPAGDLQIGRAHV